MISFTASIDKIHHQWDTVCRSVGSVRTPEGQDVQFLFEHHSDLFTTSPGDTLDVRISEGASHTVKAPADYIMNGYIAQIQNDHAHISCGGLLMRLPRSLVRRKLPRGQGLQVAVSRRPPTSPRPSGAAARRRSGGRKRQRTSTGR